MTSTQLIVSGVRKAPSRHAGGPCSSAPSTCRRPTHASECCPRLPLRRSYAYDGRRRMRWHVNHHTYGQHWVAGDTIGCGIDLDSGTMRFTRTGRDLVSIGKAGWAPN